MRESPRQWSRVTTILALLLAVGGIAAPILWDVLGRKGSVELRHLSQSVVVQKSENLPKLELAYDGHRLLRLASLTFTLANTGSKPIVQSDLVSPPTIRFSGDSRILESRIDGVYPQNLVVKIEPTPDTHGLSISFLLLNPGDNVRLNVLIADYNDLKFTADARIIGIDKLTVVSDLKEPAKASKSKPWVTYIVGFFTLASFLLAIACATDIPKERKLRRALRSGAYTIDAGMTKEAALVRMKEDLSWATKAESKPIMEFIDKLPAERSLNEEERLQLEKMVGSCAKSATSNIAVTIVFGLLGVTGAVYATMRIIS